MSKIWFRAKIRYEKTEENGMNKRVSENYLVDALSFTEAEARIIDEVTPFISGEFTVTDLKRENISELFSSEADKDDRWYKIKVAFVTLDEKSGRSVSLILTCLYKVLIQPALKRCCMRE
jgi:hypothetical protein